MTWRSAALFMRFTGMMLCSSAAAGITAFWEPATITPAAIADDPQLAGMQSWDLMATTTGDWAGAALGAHLLPIGTHSFYKHQMGGFIKPPPVDVLNFPALGYTTHVTRPNDDGTNNNTILLGGPFGGQPLNLGDPTSPIPGFFAVAWGDTFIDPPGTFQIARLTFPQDAASWAIVGSDPATSSHTAQNQPHAVAFIPQIPEPTGIGVFVLALLASSRGANRQLR